MEIHKINKTEAIENDRRALTKITCIYFPIAFISNVNRRENVFKKRLY